MEASEQYRQLTEKLEAALPLKARPTRELIHIFRKKGISLTLKTDLTITSIHNSGDISGIMCTVHPDGKNVIACGLTHLIFPPNSTLFREISDYQVKRQKRIAKLNRFGLN